MGNVEPTIRLYDPHSREEEAELTLKQTHFSSPRIAIFLIVTFVLLILCEGVVQHFGDIAAARDLQTHPTTTPGRELFRAVSIFSLLPSSTQIATAHTFWDYWHLQPDVKNINAFEKGLERDSILGGIILPRTQYFLTSRLGAGNEQAYPGNNRWLFYRPEIEYLTGPGFLQPKVLKARSRDRGDFGNVQPNPITAITQFHDQLAKRDITLIVMPVPAKPMIYPELFASGGQHFPVPLQNPDYSSFCAALAQKGISVFDLSDTLIKEKAHAAAYLKTDTHWTPDAMAHCAQALAAHLTQQRQLPVMPPVVYTHTTKHVENLGDIAVMLKLPADQTYFSREDEVIAPVLQPDGTSWQSSPNADVLLLGDSYCNIYSLAGMGWGEGAGFTEQLSAALQRPVEKIVMNAGGAYAARQQLYKEMMRGKDHLLGKKVVIYEFAVRDLSSGDWRLYDLPAAKPVTPIQPHPLPNPHPNQLNPKNPPDQHPTNQHPGTHTGNPGDHPPTHPGTQHPTPVDIPVRVHGTIKTIAPIPTPGSVPYKDCLIAIHLTDVAAIQGKLETKEIVVFVWGLHDNKTTIAGGYQVGQILTLPLTPWAKVENTYGGYNRVELDDPDTLALDTYWGEKR